MLARLARFTAAYLAALWLACAPALALALPQDWTVYSTSQAPVVTQLGTATHGAVTTLVLTTTADAPAHSTIIVWGNAIGGTVTFTITDANGDTFTKKNNVWNTTNNAGVSYVINTSADLASGSSITMTTTASADVSLVAIDVSNLNGGADITGTQVTGSATSTSVSTGALAQAAELVCGATFMALTAGTWTEASGFTSETQATGPQAWIYPACDIVNATTSVTYAPSWTSTRVYGANVWSWKSP